MWLDWSERTQPQQPRETRHAGYHPPNHPAGKISWEECSQLSASIQQLQIQFLWFLNQFLGYKWKKEKATTMLPRIKAVAGLETPQISTQWRKLFRRHLNPLHLCIASMENEITPTLASECFSSCFTPGPKICQGPAGHVQSSGWRPARGRRKGSRLKPVRNEAYKTVFAILLPDGKRKGQEHTEVTEWGGSFIVDFSYQRPCTVLVSGTCEDNDRWGNICKTFKMFQKKLANTEFKSI